MTVTRDIVLDLLPLYAAGEASADSRAAVEALVQADPTVATLLRALQQASALRDPADAEPSALLERAAINRTRSVVRRRAWTLGLALASTLLPLTFGVSGGGVEFFLLRDHPITALFWVVAAWLWWQHFRLTRELKSAGLT